MVQARKQGQKIRKIYLDGKMAGKFQQKFEWQLQFIINQMQKKVKNEKNCQEHNFQMRPLTEGLFLKQQLKVSFCRKKEEEKNQIVKEKEQSCEDCKQYPIFNKDKNKFTNSFILPQEKKSQIEYHFLLRNHPQMTIIERKKSKIQVPKPSSGHTFCRVCRVHYADYLEHINSLPHKKNLNKSKGTFFIAQLTSKYQNFNNSKKKQITSEANEEKEVEELGKARKKQKRSDMEERKSSSKDMSSNRKIGEFYGEGNGKKGHISRQKYSSPKNDYERQNQQYQKDPTFIDPWIESCLLQYPWIYQHMASKGLLPKKPRFQLLKHNYNHFQQK